MMIRRDWLLKQLGITQWTPRSPAVFQGEVAVNLPKHIYLLLVADKLPPLAHPLVIDVARSMALTSDHLHGVSPLQVMRVPNNIRCHCWWIGLDVLRNFKGISFQTPPLAVFGEDVDAKRKLWRWISSNDAYHITDKVG